MSAEIRDQFFTDMLATAPSACRLWSRWHHDTHDPSTQHVSVHADGCFHGTHQLNRHQLEQAWPNPGQAAPAGRWDHCRGDTLSTVTDIDTALRHGDDDLLDTDGCIVDGVVQCALFGDIRYG